MKRTLAFLFALAAAVPLGAQSAAICHAIAFVQVGTVGLPLHAEYRTQTGNLASKTWTWRSGNNTVATVSATGLVTGVSPGSTWIEARTVGATSTSTTYAAKACVRIAAAGVQGALPVPTRQPPHAIGALVRMTSGR